MMYRNDLTEERVDQLSFGLDDIPHVDVTDGITCDGRRVVLIHNKRPRYTIEYIRSLYYIIIEKGERFAMYTEQEPIYYNELMKNLKEAEQDSYWG